MNEQDYNQLVAGFAQFHLNRRLPSSSQAFHLLKFGTHWPNHFVFTITGDNHLFLGIDVSKWHITKVHKLIAKAIEKKKWLLEQQKQYNQSEWKSSNAALVMQQDVLRIISQNAQAELRPVKVQWMREKGFSKLHRTVNGLETLCSYVIATRKVLSKIDQDTSVCSICKNRSIIYTVINY